MYADNQFKFVAVLNKKTPLPQLMNALGHMAAGLTSLYPDAQPLRFYCYTDADGGKHPAISHHPWVILEAKNGNQIRTLRQQAIEAGLVYNDFTGSMLGVSAEDQLQKTEATRETDLDYFGIVLFGTAEVLNALTRKFSLFH